MEFTVFRMGLEPRDDTDIYRLTVALQQLRTQSAESALYHETLRRVLSACTQLV